MAAGPQDPVIPKVAAEEIPASSAGPDPMASGKGNFRTSGQPFIDYNDIPAGASTPNSKAGLAKLLGGLGAGGLGAAGLYALLNGEDPSMIDQAQQAVAG